ncbi:Calx-beta domain-containing protein [Chroococcus sp. FPU101]|uniref:Calx-beta domain-containing protein n=1 Tax=Chroococcus sp. FPU101 TaxID=1974212 RepID=UPI001A8DEF44|nr:Calx-beta domain-containing protein [Chroococcus sp. FPU101]GFE70296.1 hypothetical protein CFPU101_29060 [Chroococcus sp. FPU101]
MSSNLVFNTTINDPSNTFTAYYTAIQSHVEAAGSYWGNYLQGNASLEVIVNFTNSIPRATGGSVTSSFVRNNGTFNVFEQGAAAEIRTGNDPNGIDPDIEINFNPDYIINELWFDNNPFTRISSLPSDKTDAVSIFIHELGHALAFSGWRDVFNGTFPGDYQSSFDEKTIFDGSNFFFVGSQATSIYGSPVPLTYGNIFHVGNNLPRPGSDLIPDLMNGVVYYRGNRYSISPLDVAILADSGLPVVSTQPVISLTISPSSVLENGNSNLIYTFTRTGSLTNPLTVNFGITGTATVSIDYSQTGATSFNATTGSITFAANSATKTLTIDPTGDTVIETNEIISLTLASNSNYTIGTTTAVTGTITNDDFPTLSINDVTLTEGNSGTKNATFTVIRTGTAIQPITVSYGTANGTAISGSDYTNTSGTLTFAINETTKTINVPIIGDTTVESNETFFVNLINPTNATLADAQGLGTITNDDTATQNNVTLALDYSGISENSSTNFIYTFIRTGSLTNSLVVNFNVAGGATLSTDYVQTGATSFTSTTGRVTFAAGASNANVVINPTGDTTLELNETVSLKLTTGTGYAVGTSSAVSATIINDDGTRRQVGTSARDVILGTNKTDVIIGGLGNDILTGGINGDLFTFQNTNEGIDRITDFTAGDDLIVVKGSTFSGGLISGDNITPNQLLIGTSATTATHRFIYNAATGALSFDRDGTGATAAIQFATLNTGLALKFEDIFVS